MAMPTSTALSTVPSPGTSRSSPHAATTMALIRIVAAPMLSGVCTETPWARTVQGEFPSPASTIRPSPVPNSHSPMSNWARRPGLGRQREGRGG